MFGLYGKNKDLVLAQKDKILNDFKSLFIDDNTFIESIESSTASPNRFLYRVRKFDEIIMKYI